MRPLRFACGIASAVLVAALFWSCADSPSAPPRTASPLTIASYEECDLIYVGPNENIPSWVFDDGDDWEIVNIEYDGSTNEVWILMCRGDGGGTVPGGDCFSSPWLPECDPDPPPPPCTPSCGGGDPGGDPGGQAADSVVVSVSADSTSVKFGSSVRFTATVIATNGGLYTPDGWSWTGKPGTTCETNLVCQMRVTASGWMRYQAHKGGAYDIDSIRITVAPPRLRVTCNGDTTQVTVTRAANVSCSATTASGGTVTAISWQFTGTVGTLNASVFGSANPLSGPVVDSGTLIVAGTIDTVAATPDSIPVNVTPRLLTNFRWLPPVNTATVPTLCGIGWFETYWGWTAPAGTCESDRVLLPLADSAGGMVEGVVSAGPNRTLRYVTSWAAGVNVGSDYIAELKGAGANFTLLRSDPGLGQCITNPALTSISTQLAPINNCTIGRVATPITAVGAAMNAHEVCHRMYDMQGFNNLNATPASDVALAPAAIEAAVHRTSDGLRVAVRQFLLDADRAIIEIGHFALDIPSGNPIPLWGPLLASSTNWTALSWDSVRTC